jgi:hypothetical protein
MFPKPNPRPQQNQLQPPKVKGVKGVKLAKLKKLVTLY